MDTANMAAALSGTKLTDEEKLRVMTTNGVVQSEAEAALATASHTAATGVAAGATAGLTGTTWSLEAALQGLKAAFLSNPLTALFTIATTLIPIIGVVNIITDGVAKSKQAVKDAAQEIVDEYDSAISTAIFYSSEYSSSPTASSHSFAVSSPGHSTAKCENQESFFAPCQCFTPGAMTTTSPGFRLCAALPSS